MKTNSSLKVGKSRIHGVGLFAQVDFQPGDYIGTFEGTPTKKNGIHVLWYEDKLKWHAIKVSNILKYANHSKSPNAEVVDMDMLALKLIKKGDEITFDYGEEWE